MTEPSKEPEILPCPFCGSDGITAAYRGQPAVAFFAMCCRCKADGPETPNREDVFRPLEPTTEANARN